jgi:hypothetical protein
MVADGRMVVKVGRDASVICAFVDPTVRFGEVP